MFEIVKDGSTASWYHPDIVQINSRNVYLSVNHDGNKIRFYSVNRANHALTLISTVDSTNIGGGARTDMCYVTFGEVVTDHCTPRPKR